MLVLIDEELNYIKVEDTVLSHCFKIGLNAAYWQKRTDTKEIIGLRLAFINGAEVLLCSKDDSPIHIEIANPDGSVQSNTNGIREEKPSTR